MGKSLHVKKGDLVKVIAGSDKGVTGKVLKVFPKENRVIVESVNLVKKHTPANPNSSGATTGGIIEAFTGLLTLVEIIVGRKRKENNNE